MAKFLGAEIDEYDGLVLSVLTTILTKADVYLYSVGEDGGTMCFAFKGKPTKKEIRKAILENETFDLNDPEEKEYVKELVASAKRWSTEWSRGF